MKFDPKIHHRRRIRLKGYDYSSEGAYFVTVCARDKECVLGEVIDGDMRLNSIGAIVELCWLEIPKHFENAVLDVYQVMPNHVHGIVRILDKPRRDLINQIPTTPNQRSNQCQPAAKRANAGVQSKPEWPLMKNPKQSLGKMIRSFKALATKKGHDAGFDSFGWQGKFYDHIIRDGRDLDRIRQYIVDNPKNWTNDDNYPENIRVDRLHDGAGNWSSVD